MAQAGTAIEATPFSISISDYVLEDLRNRLANSRFPDPLPYDGWRAGFDLAYLKDLVDYWRNDFDWSKQERWLNSFPQFTANLAGQTIHFVHVHGKGPNPMPLVMTHGWPSCFVEMLKIAPLLADPAAHGADAQDSFDVVIPSLPGYTFSSAPSQPGLTAGQQPADLWARLMTEVLGYRRFGAQGQDIGASLTIRLGWRHGDLVTGIHLPGVIALPPADQPLSEAGKAFNERRQQWSATEGAYAMEQGTKPQTLASGLNDSPIGLAAWIVEKYRSWSDCDGDVEKRFTKDELLTVVTLYWVTECINSSFLFYFESRRDPSAWAGLRVDVPTGVAIFPKEIPFTGPREWAEPLYDIQRWTPMPRGGHFPTWEEPELYAHELRKFFRPLR